MPELLLTCEHAGNEVPARWRPLFRGADALLRSHRGWDPGALGLARALARATGAPLIATRRTRLLADPNRSEGHPRLFSERTRDLPPEERERLLASVWRPHRDAVAARVAALRAEGATILHVGVHSFTPVLDGVRRTADVGLLYDPARGAEAETAARWQAALAAIEPALRVRRNYPYRGTSDGLTTTLRRRWADGYLGIELEVGQALLTGPARGRVTAAVRRSLERVLAP